MSVIAFIPARAGSKRLPDKNIKMFCGKPLVAWTVEAAVRSQIFSKIVISSDYLDLLDILGNLRAQVSFDRRPNELCGDRCLMFEVLSEYLKRALCSDPDLESVCLLQPTSPLRTEAHIREAYKKFTTTSLEMDCLVSVTEVPHQFCPDNMYLNASDNELLKPCMSNTSSQHTDYATKPKYFVRNGPAIFFGKIKTILSRKALYSDWMHCFVMDRRSSVDIDTQEDWDFAEYLFRKQCKEYGI